MARSLSYLLKAAALLLHRAANVLAAAEGEMSFLADPPVWQPEQIHLGLGATIDIMTVHWVGARGEPSVKYGTRPDELSSQQIGSSYVFTDSGPEKRNLTMHMVNMTDLQPDTDYYYQVGVASGTWSTTFLFRSAPSIQGLNARGPMVYGVYGDLGDANGQSMPSIKKAAYARELDMILHVGDFAYDLHDDNGRNGDAFMRDIESIAAWVPYMVCPGNHESYYNFSHYTQRFRNMPSNSGTLTMPEFGTVPNNWWFSWDSGLVHFVSISTELYFSQQQLVPRQYEWLTNDLASVNRSRTPWVVVNGHRPLYCSCDGDCWSDATRNRMGLEVDGKFRYGLEEVFNKYGVDMYIAAHEHNYERMFDVAPHWNPLLPMLSGATTKSTVDPPAPTYIVTGSAGNVEEHEPFVYPKLSRTAARFNTFGWSKMTVYNASHLFWEQIQTDDGGWDKVVDSTWIVQNSHGPFSAHPRRHVRAEPIETLEGSMEAADSYPNRAQQRPQEEKCWRKRRGEALVCEDQARATSMKKLGQWQATKVLPGPGEGIDSSTFI